MTFFKVLLKNMLIFFLFLGMRIKLRWIDVFKWQLCAKWSDLLSDFKGIANNCHFLLWIGYCALIKYGQILLNIVTLCWNSVAMYGVELMLTVWWFSNAFLVIDSYSLHFS